MSATLIDAEVDAVSAARAEVSRLRGEIDALELRAQPLRQLYQGEARLLQASLPSDEARRVLAVHERFRTPRRQIVELDNEITALKQQLRAAEQAEGRATAAIRQAGKRALADEIERRIVHEVAPLVEALYLALDGLDDARRAVETSHGGVQLVDEREQRLRALLRPLAEAAGVPHRASPSVAEAESRVRGGSAAWKQRDRRRAAAREAAAALALNGRAVEELAERQAVAARRASQPAREEAGERHLDRETRRARQEAATKRAAEVQRLLEEANT